jgi:uncharacterized protein
VLSFAKLRPQRAPVAAPRYAWNMLESVLSERELRAVRDYVAAREPERRHLVAYVSGAHAAGFATTDSDVHLRCIHVAATGDLVGLTPSADGADRRDRVDNVAIAYGSEELAGALRGAVQGDGDALERFLGDLIVASMPELLAESRPIVSRLLSQRVGHHYAAEAIALLRSFDDAPSADRALHVLRATATARHLLDTGELVTDLRQLTPRYAAAEVAELVEHARRPELCVDATALAARWRPRLSEAIAAIDDATAASCLPAEPPARAVAEADEWLRSVRRHYW